MSNPYNTMDDTQLRQAFDRLVEKSKTTREWGIEAVDGSGLYLTNDSQDDLFAEWRDRIRDGNK